MKQERDLIDQHINELEGNLEFWIKEERIRHNEILRKVNMEEEDRPFMWLRAKKEDSVREREEDG